jgi:hypothetical protein
MPPRDILGVCRLERIVSRQASGKASARYREARVRNSSEVKRIEADARFSSRWAIEDVPGIGNIAGERWSSQASEIWLAVALRRWAIRASAGSGSQAYPLQAGTTE